MKLFDIFNVFKKKKDLLETRETSRSSPGLPGDLERFRVRRYPLAPPEPEYPSMPEPQFRVPEQVVEEPKIEYKETDKMDLILQRLETIDTRLKLIEERTRK